MHVHGDSCPFGAFGSLSVTVIASCAYEVYCWSLASQLVFQECYCRGV